MSGWEPQEFTRYHYEDGRLVGATVSREPEWDESDRLSVFAELEQRRMTGAHGQPMDEATDPGMGKQDSAFRYVAEPYTDFAQKVLDETTAEYRKQWGDAVPAGLRWSVKKVPR